MSFSFYCSCFKRKTKQTNKIKPQPNQNESTALSSWLSELTLNSAQEKSSILNNAYYCLAFQLKLHMLSMINMAKLFIDTRYVSFPPGFQPWTVCLFKLGEFCPWGTEVEVKLSVKTCYRKAHLGFIRAWFIGESVTDNSFEVSPVCTVWERNNNASASWALHSAEGRMGVWGLVCTCINLKCWKLPIFPIYHPFIPLPSPEEFIMLPSTHAEILPVFCEKHLSSDSAPGNHITFGNCPDVWE